jgi:hypothetical protein
MIRYVCCLCISEQDSAKRTVLYGILIECCMARRLVRLIIVHFSLTNSHEFDLSLFLNFHLEWRKPKRIEGDWNWMPCISF